MMRQSRGALGTCCAFRRPARSASRTAAQAMRRQRWSRPPNAGSPMQLSTWRPPCPANRPHRNPRPNTDPRLRQGRGICKRQPQQRRADPFPRPAAEKIRRCRDDARSAPRDRQRRQPHPPGARQEASTPPRHRGVASANSPHPRSIVAAARQSSWPGPVPAITTGVMPRRTARTSPPLWPNAPKIPPPAYSTAPSHLQRIETTPRRAFPSARTGGQLPSTHREAAAPTASLSLRGAQRRGNLPPVMRARTGRGLPQPAFGLNPMAACAPRNDQTWDE